MLKSMTSIRRQFKLWNAWQSPIPLLKKAGEDLNKDASYDKVSEGLQAAIGELNDAQQDEEIAQEQLCNRRDRHDKDFLEEPVLKVKDAQRFGEIAQGQVYESVIDDYQRCKRPPRKV